VEESVGTNGHLDAMKKELKHDVLLLSKLISRLVVLYFEFWLFNEVENGSHGIYVVDVIEGHDLTSPPNKSTFQHSEKPVPANRAQNGSCNRQHVRCTSMPNLMCYHIVLPRVISLGVALSRLPANAGKDSSG
jgi:hypothetical protein